MKLLNDKDDISEVRPTDGVSVLLHSSLVALGMVSVVLGPLPMIVAHQKLPESSARVACLLGALAALLLLKVPLTAVLILFSFGIFVADATGRHLSFWRSMLGAVALASAVGLISIVLSAPLSRQSLPVFLHTSIDRMVFEIRETQKMLGVVSTMDSEIFKRDILWKIPGLFLSGMILTQWFSIGLAAHFGWLASPHRFSALRLRMLRVPMWLRGAFLLFFIGTLVSTGQGMRDMISSLLLITGSIIFIQGCVCLSNILNRFDVGRAMRTIIYIFAVSFGFYAVVGMGLVAPRIGNPRNPLTTEENQ